MTTAIQVALFSPSTVTAFKIVQKSAFTTIAPLLDRSGIIMIDGNTFKTHSGGL